MDMDSDSDSSRDFDSDASNSDDFDSDDSESDVSDSDDSDSDDYDSSSNSGSDPENPEKKQRSGKNEPERTEMEWNQYAGELGLPNVAQFREEPGEVRKKRRKRKEGRKGRKRRKRRIGVPKKYRIVQGEEKEGEPLDETLQEVDDNETHGGRLHKSHLRILRDLRSKLMKEEDIDFQHLECLSWRQQADTWRVSLSSGEGYILSRHSFWHFYGPGSRGLRIDEMEYKGEAADYIGANLPVHPTVGLPVVVDSAIEQQYYSVIMRDAGPRNLNEAYLDPAVDVDQIGTEIGDWLALFHTSPIDTVPIRFLSNDRARPLVRQPYAMLPQCCKIYEEYGCDEEFGHEVSAYFGGPITSESRRKYRWNPIFTHGDFWPGNIVVAEDKYQKLMLTVVDWKYVHVAGEIGGAVDVGHFAAEAYRLDRYHGGRDLRRSFLRGYRRAAKKVNKMIDNDFIRRVAARIGVQIMYWHSYRPWVPAMDTEELVKVAYGLLERTWENREDWAVGTLVEELLETGSDDGGDEHGTGKSTLLAVAGSGSCTV